MARQKSTKVELSVEEQNELDKAAQLVEVESDKFEKLKNDCAHLNTEVRNYDKETQTGELWCKQCGGQLEKDYKVTE